MQERAVPNLSDIIDKKIKYLCKFTDENNQKFCHWCVGVIQDVSSGTDNPKWKKIQKDCAQRNTMEEAKVAEILFEALLGEESPVTIVQLKPGKWDKNSEHAWRLFYE